MSERVMTQLSEPIEDPQHLPLCAGNLSDFDPSRDTLANNQLEELDGWMIERTAISSRSAASGMPRTNSIAFTMPSTTFASWTSALSITTF